MTLRTYVDAWAQSADSTLALLGDLPAEAWDAPTGCPGWAVRDVVAHLAALESELAGTDIGALPGAAEGGPELSSTYTEAGVDQRRDVTPAKLVEELSTAVAARKKALEVLPADPTARAEKTPHGIAWSNETALRNRMVDMWVHEQDIRTAAGRPGGFGEAADAVLGVFLPAVAYVLAKKVGAARGTLVVLELTGPVSRTMTVEVGQDGRGGLQEGAADEPDVHLTMPAETFIALLAGREAITPLSVSWTGDSSLVGDLLAEIAVTP